MSTFRPKLRILPESQRQLWKELSATPRHFTLYGGTALALRLGHRHSVDFDFFTKEGFDPDQLRNAIAYLQNSETVQNDANTLTCRVNRDGPVMISFFGGLNLGQVHEPDFAAGPKIAVASLADLAATKADVIQKRAEQKDYIDIDALVRNGFDLSSILAAAATVYGPKFNPTLTLKALAYYDDVPGLTAPIRKRLQTAVKNLNPAHLARQSKPSKDPAP